MSYRIGRKVNKLPVYFEVLKFTECIIKTHCKRWEICEEKMDAALADTDCRKPVTCHVEDA